MLRFSLICCCLMSSSAMAGPEGPPIEETPVSPISEMPPIYAVVEPNENLESVYVYVYVSVDPLAPEPIRSPACFLPLRN